jgi:hypothetical protein
MRLMTPYNLQVMSLPKTIVKSNYRIEIRMNTQQHHSIIVPCYCRKWEESEEIPFVAAAIPTSGASRACLSPFPLSVTAPPILRTRVWNKLGGCPTRRFWRKADAKISQIRLNRMSARTARRHLMFNTWHLFQPSVFFPLCSLY